MKHKSILVGLTLILLIPLACGGGGSGDTDEGTVVVGGQGGQQVVDSDVIADAQEQRASNEEGESQAETLSVEDVEVEELNETPAEETEEDDIEVSESEEDPLDNLLNAVSIFQSCLDDEGFEFIGAPGQPGPDGETVDPSEFDQGYLQALQKCAVESNILESFTSFSEAQANLTPEDIAQLNFGIPVFKECMERLGWEVDDLVPDERGQLGFGTTGTGLTPPEGTEGLLNTDDINECRQEATTYTQENYVAEEES